MTGTRWRTRAYVIGGLVAGALATSGCAAGEDAVEPAAVADEELTSSQWLARYRAGQSARVRRHFGGVTWETPEAEANALTTEQLLATNAAFESGRFDAEIAGAVKLSEETGSCATPDEKDMCGETTTLFASGERRFVKSVVVTNWTPRDAREEWYLLLDRPTARSLAGSLRAGEKKDGREHIYFPFAKTFRSDPDAIAPGARPFFSKVETASGTFVRAFEALFLFDPAGKVWEIQIHRACADGQSFDGDRCR